jgi:hypothetical protein
MTHRYGADTSRVAYAVVLATALVVSTVSPAPAPAGETSTISGTIRYTGSQGPVSAERPILILVWDNSFLEGEPVAGMEIASDDSPFEIEVPAAGEYFLAHILDTNGDRVPNVGDPFRVYENDFGTPGDPLTAPATDVFLSFDDAAGMPGIRGTLTYTGSQGPVAEDRPLRIEVFRQPNLTEPIAQRPRLVENGAAYQVIILDSRFHYLRAYLDLNDNGEHDEGEPFTIYDGRTAPAGDPLPGGVADLDLSFGDEALPTPTANPTATPVPVEISGTIEYTGERGPVSVARPIIMFLLTNADFDGPPVAFTLVDTNGGAFVLGAPAPGNYYLGMLLDTNGDSMPAVGDPYEIYNNRSMPPGDPLAAPQSGLSLSFGDAGGLPGVAGSVTYTGSLATVGETSPILVEFFRDADFTDQIDALSVVTSNGGAYSFVRVGTDDTYLRAFVDLNNNNALDPGEPFTLYDGKVSPPGDPLPQLDAMLDLSFGDAAVVSCVGDCSGDGQVTIDELIVGVSIALDEEDISECPAFDRNGSVTVTIDELIKAINNALSGCP